MIMQLGCMLRGAFAAFRAMMERVSGDTHDVRVLLVAFPE